MQAIVRVTRRAGCLLLGSTDSDPDVEVALLRGLRNRYVDGLILSPIRVTPVRPACACRTTRVVRLAERRSAAQSRGSPR